MDCPKKELLVDLLSAEHVIGTEGALWDHLETCRFCRIELDRLTDDPELSRWRKVADENSVNGEEADAKLAIVRDIVDREMDTDLLRSRSTISDHSNEAPIANAFQPSPIPGDLGKLGQYRILRLIGQGGMAMVYEAVDVLLNRRVALKILRSQGAEPLSHQRFLVEARALAGVRHNNVVAVHSVFEADNGLSTIAMELVEGETLQETIKRDQEIEPKLAAQWVADIATGLAAVHRIGVVHRDIKPSNILISKDDGRSIAKLADFGLARFTSISQKVTQTGVLLGTPSYMSPEHIARPESCDARSDIYSLGVTMYEMLSGEVPFRGALHTVLQRIGRDDPVPLRTLNTLIPRDLETICAKAMHRDPKSRYWTATELAEDLERWLSGRPILAKPTSSIEHFVGWCNRNRGTALLAGAIAGLLIALSAVATYSAISIQSADVKLRAEKKTVEDTSQRLKVAANEALKQRQIALASLNDLVTKVQSELASRPGTLKVRESILETAIKGLDQITVTTDTTDIDPVLIQACIRKGEIFDLLGKTAQSVVELERARKLAEAFVEHDRNNEDAKRELGNALVAQADIAMRRNSLDEALTLYERVLPIREEAANQQPGDFNSQKALMLILQRQGDVYRYRFDFSKASELYQRFLKTALSTYAAHSESTIAKRDLSIAYERVATVDMIRGQVSSAESGFKRALELNKELLIEDSDNKHYNGDQAYFAGNLARLFSSRGEHGEAIAHAKEAIEYSEKVSESDPKDLDAKMKLGLGWLALHDVQFAAGNLEEAEKAIVSGIAIDTSLCTADPNSTKYAIHGADLCDILLGLQARQGKSSASVATLKDSLRFLERCQKVADSKPEAFEPRIALQKNSLAAVELAIEWTKNGIDGLSESLEVDPEILYVARVVTMYELARVGDPQRAIKFGEAISRSPSQNPIVLQYGQFIVARAYALAYAHLVQQESEDNRETTPMTETALNGLKSHLKSFLTNPMVAQNSVIQAFCKKELDFESVREHPVFLALFGNAKE